MGRLHLTAWQILIHLYMLTISGYRLNFTRRAKNLQSSTKVPFSIWHTHRWSLYQNHSSWCVITIVANFLFCCLKLWLFTYTGYFWVNLCYVLLEEAESQKIHYINRVRLAERLMAEAMADVYIFIHTHTN